MTDMQPPFVVDLSHYDTVSPNGFQSAKSAGVVGVIHKATQGISVIDAQYDARRPLAKAAGLLWGAYHFNTGDPVKAQVDHFFDVAKPDNQTLMALDFEDNPASEMSIAQCAEFLDLADQKLGRKLALYSGNRIRELLPNADSETQEFVATHPLWLAEYGPMARIPAPWTKYFLWQFTGDGSGPLPHDISGFLAQGGLDINVYGGASSLTLAKDWVS
jgi:lysozyme